MPRRESYSDRAAFPDDRNTGMSYRFWLIGQIAGAQDMPASAVLVDPLAKNIIALADAIIRQLDGEANP